MRGVAGLTVTAAVLIAIIVSEIVGAPRANVAPLRPHPSTAASPVPTPSADRTHDWVTTALARPLFSADRRPAAEAVAAGAGPAGLPRLTGILIGPFGRS